MTKPRLRGLVLAVCAAAALTLLTACGGATQSASGGDAGGETTPGAIEGIGGRTLAVTTTTNVITDLARQIGGDRVVVTGLMGPGVDPHLYKASAGDVGRLDEADVILYGGLELEGKMTDLLDEMADDHVTVAVTRDVPESELLPAGSAHQGAFDPHMWFDVSLWKQAAATVADTFAAVDPEHEPVYRANLDAYLAELDELDAYMKERATEVPERSRVIVTSHDAFHYLGRRYGFDVEGIQGVSTQTEATTADIERIAGLIADRGVKAVFVESSVPPQTIDAVLAAAGALGWQATVGGELYSDSAGAEGTPEGTYVGMLRHNIDTIVEALR